MNRFIKRFILLICLFWGCIIAAPARTFVLIIGISNYGETDLNLQQTSKDAYSFYEIMHRITPDVSLLTSSNCSYDNVLAKLDEMVSLAQEDDDLIFFFSGHGTDGGLLLYGRKILEFDVLLEKFKKSKSKARFAFIDACHAGSVYESASQEKLNTNTVGNSLLFVSCRNAEVSRESSYLGAGYFTRALVLGLRGKADIDKNNDITAIELMKYIYADVLRRTNERQHPQLIGSSALHNRVLIHLNRENILDSLKITENQFDAKIKVFHKNN